MTTNDITLAKQQLATALIATGLDVQAFIPDRITPPIVIINAGSPLLTPMSLGTEYYLNLQIVLVASTSMNKDSSEELDALICSFLNAIENLHYVALSSVDSPYTLATGAAEYLAANANIQLSITL